MTNDTADLNLPEKPSWAERARQGAAATTSAMGTAAPFVALGGPVSLALYSLGDINPFYGALGQISAVGGGLMLAAAAASRIYSGIKTVYKENKDVDAIRAEMPGVAAAIDNPDDMGFEAPVQEHVMSSIVRLCESGEGMRHLSSFLHTGDEDTQTARVDAFRELLLSQAPSPDLDRIARLAQTESNDANRWSDHPKYAPDYNAYTKVTEVVNQGDHYALEDRPGHGLMHGSPEDYMGLQESVEQHSDIGLPDEAEGDYGPSVRI